MLLITAAWGSCFVAIDWGLRDAPVIWFAAFRSLLAGAVLVAVGFIGLAITASASIDDKRRRPRSRCRQRHGNRNTPRPPYARRRHSRRQRMALFGGAWLSLLAFFRKGAPSVSWTP